jgi:hypothetical protein
MTVRPVLDRDAVHVHVPQLISKVVENLLQRMVALLAPERPNVGKVPQGVPKALRLSETIARKSILRLWHQPHLDIDYMPPYVRSPNTICTNLMR